MVPCHPMEKGGRTPTRDSDVPLAALPQLRGTHLVTAFSPGGAQPDSLSAPPTRPLPERHAHPGSCMWTLRLPSAMALMLLVDVSRWPFLSLKTLQSETMGTTYQRPENCKTAQ